MEQTIILKKKSSINSNSNSNIYFNADTMSKWKILRVNKAITMVIQMYTYL